MRNGNNSPVASGKEIEKAPCGRGLRKELLCYQFFDAHSKRTERRLFVIPVKTGIQPFN